MLKASRIRILVVDDFEPWRRFVSTALQSQPDLEIIGEAADGLVAVQKAGELQPDLILLDIGLPALNGIESARRIQSLSPKSKILFISEHRSVDMAKAAVSAGGNGYLVKSDAGSELLPAVKAVFQGKKFASASLGVDVFAEAVDANVAQLPGSFHVPSSPENIEFSRRHEVAFYPDDASFVDGLAQFAKTALKDGSPVIVIATKSHRAEIRKRLIADGVDVAAAIRDKTFIEADSLRTLATFMVNEVPDAARVKQVTTDLIAHAAKAAPGERRRLAICGALAPVLLENGNLEAAFQVERLFDDVARSHDISLLCGYVLSGLPRNGNRRLVERICAEHSSVHMA